VQGAVASIIHQIWGCSRIQQPASAMLGDALKKGKKNIKTSSYDPIYYII
jgi:hypothetical protein